MSAKMRATRDEEPERDGLYTESDLRRAYFAHAAEIAVRYSVTVDRVLRHLECALAHHSSRSVPAVRHMDDLVHAAACVDGYDIAWRDLVDRYERPLVRACRQWLEATDAIVFVRRLLAELRRDEPTGIRSLRSFDGSCTLRRWLGDRVFGGLSVGGAILRSDTGTAPEEARRRADDRPAGAWPESSEPAAPAPFDWQPSTGVSG